MTLCADGNDPVELNMSIPTNASTSTKDAFMYVYVRVCPCSRSDNFMTARRWKWCKELQHDLSVWPLDGWKQGSGPCESLPLWIDW